MSNSLDGLQFPNPSQKQKPSTSKAGREIIAEALASVDHSASQKAAAEKNWRKQYPQYFKALVEHGIQNSQKPLEIAEAGLNKAHHTFEFFRNGQKHLLKDVMQLEAQPLYTVKLKGESEAAPDWYVPYHGQKLQGEALLAQIQKWQDEGIIEPSHADALREAASHPE